MLRRNLSVVLLVFLTIAVLAGCQAPWLDPPDTFQGADLEGVWQATYSVGDTDTLIIHRDGKFRQIYDAPRLDDYHFETTWQDWTVEGLANGEVRLHLRGARYYIGGITWAERSGRNLCPEHEPECATGTQAYSFHDPFSGELVTMLDELVLNVRMTSSGELILHHNWLGGDGGFALIGGDEEIFHRVEAIAKDSNTPDTANSGG